MAAQILYFVKSFLTFKKKYFKAVFWFIFFCKIIYCAGFMVIFQQQQGKNSENLCPLQKTSSKWKHQHSSTARTLLLPHHQNFQDIKAFASSLGRECSDECFSAQHSGLSALLSNQSHCCTLPHLLWDLLKISGFTTHLDQIPSRRTVTSHKDLLTRIGPLWEDAFEQLSSFSARSKTVSTLSFDLGITADGSAR